MKSNPGTYEALIKRTFPHPVSRVYRAWTQPEHVAAWLKPSEEVSLKVISFNLSLGGKYDFRGMNMAAGFSRCAGNFLPWSRSV